MKTKEIEQKIYDLEDLYTLETGLHVYDKGEYTEWLEGKYLSLSSDAKDEGGGKRNELNALHKDNFDVPSVRGYNVDFNQKKQELESLSSAPDIEEGEGDKVELLAEALSKGVADKYKRILAIIKESSPTKAVTAEEILKKEDAVKFVKDQGLNSTLLVGSRTKPIYLEDLLMLFYNRSSKPVELPTEEAKAEDDDVMKVAEKLYYEANPNTKMDVPSYAYEQVEKANKKRLSENSELNLYEWCKKALRKERNKL